MISSIVETGMGPIRADALALQRFSEFLIPLSSMVQCSGIRTI